MIEKTSKISARFRVTAEIELADGHTIDWWHEEDQFEQKERAKRDDFVTAALEVDKIRQAMLTEYLNDQLARVAVEIDTLQAELDAQAQALMDLDQRIEAIEAVKRLRLQGISVANEGETALSDPLAEATLQAAEDRCGYTVSRSNSAAVLTLLLEEERRMLEARDALRTGIKQNEAVLETKLNQRAELMAARDDIEQQPESIPPALADILVTDPTAPPALRAEAQAQLSDGEADRATFTWEFDDGPAVDVPVPKAGLQP